MALPGPLTLAWFVRTACHTNRSSRGEWARGHATHADAVARRQHRADPGPNPLRIDLPPNVNQILLRDAIAAVEYRRRQQPHGQRGHAGSVADGTGGARGARMACCSSTASWSRSVCVARNWRAARDVFIDNVADASVIWQQIRYHRTFCAQAWPRDRHRASAAARRSTRRSVAADAAGEGLRAMAAVGHRGLARRPGSGARHDLAPPIRRSPSPSKRAKRRHR